MGITALFGLHVCGRRMDGFVSVRVSDEGASDQAQLYDF